MTAVSGDRGTAIAASCHDPQVDELADGVTAGWYRRPDSVTSDLQEPARPAGVADALLATDPSGADRGNGDHP